MILTDQQKAEFSRWLEAEIIGAQGLAEQMGKTGMPPAVQDAITRKYRAEAAACQVVLRMIQSGESMSIG